jgi:hypothetical protein
MIQRDIPDSTARFIPPANTGSAGAQDIYQVARPPAIAPVQGNLGTARYTVNAVGRDYPGLYHWSLQVYDSRSGMRQRGRFDESHANWSSNTFDQRYEQTSVHSQLTTAYSSPAASSGISMSIHSAWIPSFNKLAVGLSDTNEAHTYLYTETSATNPALTQLTYDKSTGMTCLAPLSVNGVDYLGVGLRGANVRLLSDLGAVPTDAGALGGASSTTAVTAMQQVPLPHSPILLHIGSAFYAGNADVAMGSFTPGVTETGVPIGGYALGTASFGGGPVKAWWVVGDGNPSYTLPGNTTGSSLDPNLFHGRLASTNLFGYQYEETYLPLKSVPIACLIRDGGAFSDTDRVIFYNGRVMRDLRIFADPPANSDKQYKVCGFYVRDRSELYAEVNEIATANGSNVTRRAKWLYDFDLDCWRQVEAWQTVTATTGIQSFFGTGRTGTLPVSQLTGFMHEHVTIATSGNTWTRQFQPTPGINPNSLRKTTGATATTGNPVEASATWTSPIWDIPGLEGMPKLVTRIQGPPNENLSAGGTGAYMIVSLNTGRQVRNPAGTLVSGDAIFTATEPTGRYPATELGFAGGWDQTVQLTVTSYRATTGTDPTLLTPNPWPITVEGFAFKQGSDVPSRWRMGKQ